MSDRCPTCDRRLARDEPLNFGARVVVTAFVLLFLAWCAAGIWMAYKVAV